MRFAHAFHLTHTGGRSVLKVHEDELQRLHYNLGPESVSNLFIRPKTGTYLLPQMRGGCSREELLEAIRVVVARDTYRSIIKEEGQVLPKPTPPEPDADCPDEGKYANHLLEYMTFGSEVLWTEPDTIGWTLSYEHPGVWQWTDESEKHHVYATPGWDGEISKVALDFDGVTDDEALALHDRIDGIDTYIGWTGKLRTDYDQYCCIVQQVLDAFVEVVWPEE